MEIHQDVLRKSDDVRVQIWGSPRKLYEDFLRVSLDVLRNSKDFVDNSKDVVDASQAFPIEIPSIVFWHSEDFLGNSKEYLGLSTGLPGTLWGFPKHVLWNYKDFHELSKDIPGNALAFFCAFKSISGGNYIRNSKTLKTCTDNFRRMSNDSPGTF